MPVVEIKTKEAHCDVCSNNHARNCAVCGGLFCARHSTQVVFYPVGYRVERWVCKNCLDMPLSRVIKGWWPSHWREDSCAEPIEYIGELLLIEREKQ